MLLNARNKTIVLFGLCLVSFLTAWKAGAIDSAWSKYLIGIQTIQRGMHSTLSNSLRAIEADGYGASMTLIGLSFMYGLFHAAGPGHGKIIISTYLFSNESQLKRGILLSFGSSIAQGLTAILLVTTSIFALDYTMRQIHGVANNLEAVSYSLMALVGLFIFFMRFKGILGSYSRKVSGSRSVNQDGSKDCNHQHAPQKSDLQNPLNLRSTFGIIASIGVRPCSGALIVLLLSYSLNIPMAGVFSVLAMSIGTALMISALAIFSVYLRQLANRFVTGMPDSNGGFFRFTDLLGGLGGLFIFVFGISLLTALLSQPAHPFR